MYIYLNVCKQKADVKLWLLYSNTWNHLTMCKKKNDLRFVLKYYQQNMFTNHIYLIFIDKHD